MRWIRFVLLAGLAGCCAPDDVFESDIVGCTESFCGEPSLKVGTGVQGYEAVADGATVPIQFGPQGGYHVDVSAQMDQLCPIVRLTVTLEVEDEGGDRVEVSAEEFRVQAVRGDGAGSIQDYWGLTALLPCGWWPLDGPHGKPDPPDCPDGTGLDGQLDGQDAWLRVRAEDDNARAAQGEVRIRPECCNQ